MLIVLLVCGLPGAGKSSFLRELVSKMTTTISTTTANESDKRQPVWTVKLHPQQDDATTTTTNMEIIEYDDLVDQEILQNRSKSAVEEDEDHPAEDVNTILQAWKTSRRLAESQLVERLTILAQQQQQHSKTTTTILFLDDNFYLRSMRKQIYRTIAGQNRLSTAESIQMTIYFGIVWYDTPLDVCIKRNRNRNIRSVPEHVIRSMHQRFEIPGSTSSKNYPTIPYWETSVLRLDGTYPDVSSHNVPAVQAFLQQLVTTSNPIPLPKNNFLENDTEQEERARAATRACIPQQQADLLWRKCVTETVRIRRELAKPANAKRKACLQQLHHPIHQDVDRGMLLELFLSPVHDNNCVVDEWLTESEKDVLRNNLLWDNENEPSEL
jgi:tRNA uridine 5-carbamoylmethylation protein Kti12